MKGNDLVKKVLVVDFDVGQRVKRESKEGKMGYGVDLGIGEMEKETRWIGWKSWLMMCEIKKVWRFDGEVFVIGLVI